jgi:5'-nucleotidase
MRQIVYLFGVLSAVLGVSIVQERTSESGTVSVRLLAFNDFHGNLEPPSGENGEIHKAAAGGVEYLATHLKRAAAENPNTLVVAAGDLVGASPLVSAAFHDEPTIESMNALNLAVSSVGNHEFDHGIPELLRLQKGACHPREGCGGRTEFRGANFTYLSANVVDSRTGATLLPATTTRTVGGVKIGFIGETLQGTDRLVAPSGVAGLRFRDEAITANRYAAELKRRGVNAIVLLIHQGGRQKADDDIADPNSCADFDGDIVSIASRLSADISVIVSGHSHRFYTCTIAGHTVTSASSFGRMFTRIDLAIDRTRDTITSVQARNIVVSRDVEKDATQTQLIAKYSEISKPIAERVVGTTRAVIARAENEAGESALGDLVADSQLAAARSASLGGADVAFMNPGGIRADVGADWPNQSVTYGDLFTTLPFGNVVTTITMTGTQIAALLEQQFDNPRRGRHTMLQVSEGFTYQYSLNAPAGARVLRGSIRLRSRSVAAGDRLRIAASNFLIDGGDGFTAFARGSNRRNTTSIDLDALISYVAAHSPVSPGPRNRIVRVD